VEVRAEGLRLEGGEVRSRRRTLAAVTFADDRPVLVLPQPQTDALLRARLHALAPEGLQPGRRVRTLRDVGEVVRVAVDGPEGPTEVTASAVVVADGVRSLFRAAIGSEWRGRSGRGSYAMLDVDDPEPGNHAILHCEPGGLVESFPLPHGRRRWVVRQGTAPLDSAPALGAEIETRTGIRLDLPANEVPAAFVAAQHSASRLVRGRVVLLGDAAHEVSPIGGQGMNLGWTDAVHLAHALATSSPERMPDLTGYERHVRRSSRAAQRRSAFYMAMGASAPQGVVRARELMIRALGSAPARDWTAGLITMRGL
jgi:2-polyprenyl-6-methoxyphenol hydroxylase-like FAD-dependent oxidoreductase